MEGDLCDRASPSHGGFKLGVSLICDDAYKGGNLLSVVSVRNEYCEHDSFSVMVMMPVVAWSFPDLWCSW